MKNRQYELTDLVERDEYEFRVSAVNKAGVGEPSLGSGVIVAKDPYDVPGKPGTPHVTDITKDTATIAWQPPDTDGGAPIDNYIIEMRQSGETRWTKVLYMSSKYSDING